MSDLPFGIPPSGAGTQRIRINTQTNALEFTTDGGVTWTPSTSGTDFVTTLGSPGASIVLSGLDGDNDGDYQIDIDLICLTNAPGAVTLRPNALTTNLASEIVFATGAAPGSAARTTLELNGNGGVCRIQGTFFMMSKTGRRRAIFGSSYSDAAGTILLYTIAGAWTDTVTNLTSLVLISANANGFDAGSSIRVRALKKKN